MLRLTASLTLSLVLALPCLVGCGGATTNLGPQQGGERAQLQPRRSGEIIRLHRRRSAGDTYTLNVETSSRQRVVTTMNGQEMSDEVEQRWVSLAADVYVIAVWDNGRPSELQVNITACGTNTQVDLCSKALTEGSTLLVNPAAPTPSERLRLQSGELSDEQLAVARLLFSLNPNHGNVTDDDLFGTAELQQPGQSWPVNAERMARDLGTTSPLQITADQIDGSVTFVGLEHVGDVPVQRFQGRAHMAGFEIADVPPGTVFHRTQADVNVEILMPVDVTLHRLRAANELRSYMEMMLPNGAMVTIEQHRSTTRIYSH